MSDEVPCACCGYLTVSERGSFEICSVCFWEDDGQDDSEAHVIKGGPNGAMSLSQARTNFQLFGACELDHIRSVRRPFSNEFPDSQ
ncbi:MAG: hypothetical protein H7330_02755 [Hymenobacteraceae bacterium]|nr:hypothetical protein [Hymenobacteraceae bacterium]